MANANDARNDDRGGGIGASRRPTPSGGNPDGSDIRTVANQIEGLLDDDGHYNPSGQISRNHPDYDPDTDPRNNVQTRDSRGRFQSKAAAQDDADDTGDQQEALQPDDDDLETDDEQPDTSDAADTETESDDDENLSEVSDNETQNEDGETDPADAIGNLAELASALDVSVDDLKEQISHTFQAAGEDVTVTLAELEKGYQKEADYRRSTAQVAEYRRAIEADLTQRQQAYEAQQHVMAQQLGMAEQLLAAELNSPQLAALRESAPDEWVAKRTEIGERIGVLQNARQQAAAAYEQFRNDNLANLRQREMQSLQQALPDFGPQHATLAKETIGSLGYTPQEVSQIFDSRLVLGALELAALRARVTELEGQSNRAAETAKRVKQDIPKLQKPGKHISPGARGKKIARDNVRRLKGRLAKSGSVDDAAALIETML